MKLVINTIILQIGTREEPGPVFNVSYPLEKNGSINGLHQTYHSKISLEAIHIELSDQYSNRNKNTFLTEKTKVLSIKPRD